MPYGRKKEEKKELVKHTVDTLYKAYADEMFAYALGFDISREMAMDAVHDVFCRLCSYDSEVFSLENHRFYLFRALRNQIISLYKRKKHPDTEVLHDDILDKIPYRVRVSIEDEMIVNEEQKAISEKVENVLDCLNSRQRELIYLYFIQECSYEEISQIMQMSVASCRKSVYRALHKLRKENKLMLFYLLLSVNLNSLSMKSPAPLHHTPHTSYVSALQGEDAPPPEGFNAFTSEWLRLFLGGIR